MRRKSSNQDLKNHPSIFTHVCSKKILAHVNNCIEFHNAQLHIMFWPSWCIAIHDNFEKVYYNHYGILQQILTYEYFLHPFITRKIWQKCYAKKRESPVTSQTQKIDVILLKNNRNHQPFAIVPIFISALCVLKNWNTFILTICKIDLLNSLIGAH